MMITVSIWKSFIFSKTKVWFFTVEIKTCCSSPVLNVLQSFLGVHVFAMSQARPNRDPACLGIPVVTHSAFWLFCES
jgi:hypothetical protein